MRTVQQLMIAQDKALDYQYELRDRIAATKPTKRNYHRLKGMNEQVKESNEYCIELQNRIDKLIAGQPRGKNKDRIKELESLIKMHKEELKTLK